MVRGTLSQRSHRAVSQAYTTADDELRRESPNVQVYSGTMPPAGTSDAQAAELISAPRQVISLDIHKTQTSCGYGVPVMQYVRQRRKEDRGRRYK